MSQFGLESGMAKAINAGKDLHKLVAAEVTGKTEHEVTKQERQNAKAINFGKPGGMSTGTLKLYAKATFGVELSDVEVEALSEAWSDLFPEMEEFLADETDLGLEIATLLELTPASHHEHTDSERFLNHPANAGRADLPYPILGGMCLKVVKEPDPTTRDGCRYKPDDVDYFWSRLDAHRDLLPSNLRAVVTSRQPSPRLQRAVMSLVGRAPVLTLTGRLRANASYCARHNTVFQGLAADGAKLALWKLWRAGYRIANFIHDQMLVEVPTSSDLLAHAKEIRRIMIEGMKAVVPDMMVGVSFAATDRWHKDAEPVYDAAQKQLLLWHPPSIPKSPRVTTKLQHAQR